MLALRQIVDDRTSTPHTVGPDGRPIRELVADGAYSRSVPVLGQYQSLGADVVFRPTQRTSNLRSDDCRSKREPGVVFERLPKRPELLVLVVGVDDDLDQHGGTSG